MGPQKYVYLIAKDKKAEQQILGKYSDCNSFGVTKTLLNSKNFKVSITQILNSMCNRSETLLYDNLSKLDE